MRRTAGRFGTATVTASAVVIGVTVVASVALGTGLVQLTSAEGEGVSAADDLPPAIATVSSRTLLERQSEDGTLGYADSRTIINRQPGTITWVPPEGKTVMRGQTLYRIDTRPITLMYGTVPMYRRLVSGVTAGPDVRQLELNLRALGYTGFTVDRNFTSSTVTAVKKWQADRGLPKTGAVDVGQVVFTLRSVRVSTTTLKVADVAGQGATVLDVSNRERVVTVELPVADQRLAIKGARVTVELPSGKTITGKITRVGTVAHQSTGSSDPTAQDPSPSDSSIDVFIDLPAKTSTGTIDEAPVTVGFIGAQRKNVLSVPVAALLALSEGGYGVEVVAGTSTQIVAVKTGLFADGEVEISGPGITAGTKVGVPA